MSVVFQDDKARSSSVERGYDLDLSRYKRAIERDATPTIEYRMFVVMSNLAGEVDACNCNKGYRSGGMILTSYLIKEELRPQLGRVSLLDGGGNDWTSVGGLTNEEAAKVQQLMLGEEFVGELSTIGLNLALIETPTGSVVLDVAGLDSINMGKKGDRMFLVGLPASIELEDCSGFVPILRHKSWDLGSLWIAVVTHKILWHPILAGCAHHRGVIPPIQPS